METEIELKFFVSPEFSDVLREKIANEKVLQQSCRELGNTYFDTQDNWLRNHDIGMRIRRYDDVFVQTVKTSGRVVAGLHQRPEFNAEHNSNEPKLTLHPEEIWPEGRSVDELQSQLTPLFATNFTREQWLVGMSDGSQIEVAFDLGKVVAGEKESPICEVELELKSGQTDALFTLARNLCEAGGMRLGNLSKAAQGYRLAQGYKGSSPKALGLVDVKESDSVEQCLIKSLEYALSHWSYHEQLYTEKDSTTALIAIREAISLIRQIFAIFGGIVPRRASALLRQELKWLEQELNWLNKQQNIATLTEDKGQPLRKLDARKWIVKQLNSKAEQLPQRREILDILQSARYTGIILDLSRWLLTKGWQPFLDEKAREQMAKPVRKFSKEQLSVTWEAIQTAFPNDQYLQEKEYIEQQYKLQRNLYTGVCFAKLYDVNERSRFRLPWEDLYQGIVELQMLSPLESLVPQLEGEEKEQLEKWIERQNVSLLNAMERTRQSVGSVSPYWLQ
jgi:triphosphatase